MRWLVLLIAVSAFSPAFADRFPALYDVTGVASDDTLNIRASASPGADIVGEFAPDETDIEVIAPSRSGAWGLVNTNEGQGWVSLRYLGRKSGQSSETAPNPAQCFGTEPFWSLTLAPGAARFESPDALPLDFAETSQLRSRNRIDRFTGVYENEIGGLVTTLANTMCGDGMSDRAYGWGVDVLLVVAGDANAQMFSGCCTLAPRR